MKLPFEKWLEASEPPDEAMVAFNEAVLAYKIGAYRAALLFSYVGMGLCLRRRLMSASKPDDVEQKQWDDIQRKLQNESKWDPTVFDCTQMKKDKDIFHVDEQLRDEMKYWRDRRNDCAHFKRNEIAAPHVESFWLFLQSNLGRWVPNGSKNDILERLDRHFDPNLTPPGADVTPIVRLFPQAVSQAEFPAFFEELVQRFSSTLGGIQHVNVGALSTIFDAVLTLAHPDVAPSAIACLHRYDPILCSVLRRQPRHVGIVLANQPQLVRNLWHNQLFNGVPRLRVFAALLRHNLIPTEEIQEAVSKFVRDLGGEIPEAADMDALQRVGFWQAFHKKAIDNNGINKFDWGNPNASLIAWWVSSNPLDEQIASVICNTFSSEPYPWSVRDALKEMFTQHPAKLQEFTALAAKTGKTVPAVILPDAPANPGGQA